MRTPNLLDKTLKWSKPQRTYSGQYFEESKNNYKNFDNPLAEDLIGSVGDV